MLNSNLDVFAPIISKNKAFISLSATYLYQVGFLGSPINQGLRKELLPQLLYQICNDLIISFNKHIPVDKDCIVYRGLPLKCVKCDKIGDIINDKAFNSVTISKKTASMFGDCILIIKLKSGDKMMYIDFYNDIHEFILYPGMRYLVTGLSKCNNTNITFINVESLGVEKYLDSPLAQINFDFDRNFMDLMAPVKEIFLSNGNKQKCDQTALLIYNRNSNGFITGFATSFRDYNQQIDHRYINEDYNQSIIESVNMYVDIFDKDIIAMYLIPFVDVVKIPSYTDKLLNCDMSPELKCLIIM